MRVSEFSQIYLKRLVEITQSIDLRQIENFFSICENARKNNNKIFFAGNGGSAATASHFSSDFLGANIKKKLKPPFRTISLTDNNSVITAFGNDFGYDLIFKNQLISLFNEGDVLVVISASGNSPNLVEAVKWVNGNNGVSVGVVGFDGGKALQLCQHTIHCQSNKGEYGPVEDIHLIIDHIINNYILEYV
jgi:D-sedoheptulose 7-phosphate isomerase